MTQEARSGTVRLKKDTYGFIRDADGGEYFFLPRQLKNCEFSLLQVGDPVRFEPQQHDRGQRAIEIFVTKEKA